jgi:hypothetical protein
MATLHQRQPGTLLSIIRLETSDPLRSPLLVIGHETAQTIARRQANEYAAGQLREQSRVLKDVKTLGVDDHVRGLERTTQET